MAALLLVVACVIVLGAMAVGYAIAGLFCKNKDAQVVVGMVLGIGFLFVIGGIAFAGCVAKMRHM